MAPRIISSCQKLTLNLARLIHFPGETLWQGEDDKVMVTLIRRNREVQVYFDHTRQLLPNNPGGNTRIGEGEGGTVQRWRGRGGRTSPGSRGSLRCPLPQPPWPGERRGHHHHRLPCASP